MSFTPGPYYVAKTGNHQRLIISESTGETIAVVYNEKNAKLLAAAPALVAAAIILLADALDRGECHDEETGKMFEDWRALESALEEVAVCG